MRIVYTPRARNDLDAIHAYLHERSPVAAASVLKAIRTRVSKLADSPLMAPMTELPDVRGLTVIRYPYKAYYRVVVRDARRAPWMGEN